MPDGRRSKRHTRDTQQKGDKMTLAPMPDTIADKKNDVSLCCKCGLHEKSAGASEILIGDAMPSGDPRPTDAQTKNT